MIITCYIYLCIPKGKKWDLGEGVGSCSLQVTFGNGLMGDFVRSQFEKKKKMQKGGGVEVGCRYM